MIKYNLRIILASGSPRRIKMLEDLGIYPRIIKPDVEEDVKLPLSPSQIVMSLALKKALAVEAQLIEQGEDLTNSLLISADTIVYADKVIGKPTTESEAFEMHHLNLAVEIDRCFKHYILAYQCIYTGAKVKGKVIELLSKLLSLNEEIENA